MLGGSRSICDKQLLNSSCGTTKIENIADHRECRGGEEIINSDTRDCGTTNEPLLLVYRSHFSLIATNVMRKIRERSRNFHRCRTIDCYSFQLTVRQTRPEYQPRLKHMLVWHKYDRTQIYVDLI
jgi:hypothetical protein